jgi:hypothetical protein
MEELFGQDDWTMVKGHLQGRGDDDVRANE